MGAEKKLSPPTVIASISKDDNLLLVVFGNTFHCSISDTKVLTFYDWEADSTSSIFVDENVITICCDPHDNDHMKEGSNSNGNIDDSSRTHLWEKCVYGLTSLGVVYRWQFHTETKVISMIKVYGFEEVKS
jgi:hypothetical protein